MHHINGQLRGIRLFIRVTTPFFRFWVSKCGPMKSSSDSGSIPNIRNYAGTSHHSPQQRVFQLFNRQLVARPKSHLRIETILPLAGGLTSGATFPIAASNAMLPSRCWRLRAIAE